MEGKKEPGAVAVMRSEEQMEKMEQCQRLNPPTSRAANHVLVPPKLLFLPPGGMEFICIDSGSSPAGRDVPLSL